MKFLFRLSMSLFSLALLACLGGVAALVMLVLLPLAAVFGGVALVVFVGLCLLLLIF